MKAVVIDFTQEKPKKPKNQEKSKQKMALLYQ